MDAKTKTIVQHDVGKEVDQIFQNIKTILDKYGTSFKRGTGCINESCSNK